MKSYKIPAYLLSFPVTSCFLRTSYGTILSKEICPEDTVWNLTNGTP